MNSGTSPAGNRFVPVERSVQTIRAKIPHDASPEAIRKVLARMEELAPDAGCPAPVPGMVAPTGAIVDPLTGGIVAPTGGISSSLTASGAPNVQAAKLKAETEEAQSKANE